MSRVGKQIITIPEKVTVVATDGTVNIKGPLGNLSRAFLSDIEIKIADGQITLLPRQLTNDSNALWGTYSSHLQNMIAGVVSGYTKKLEIEGVGFKANVSGQKLVLNIGLSHPVDLAIPEGLKVAVDKNVITVTGIDKEAVGHFAAKIRDQKKPEPYKGKGIHYEGEVIRRKEGKKVVS